VQIFVSAIITQPNISITPCHSAAAWSTLKRYVHILFAILLSTPFSTDRKQVSGNGNSKQSTVCIVRIVFSRIFLVESLAQMPRRWLLLSAN